MTIQIPDDLTRGLEGIAASQHKSVEQLAVERLRTLIVDPASPRALLEVLRGLPHPSDAAVNDLESAIETGTTGKA
ncbi:MAG: hypothetical protein ABI824_03445 [Acidobacteriota bacterium]